MSFPSIFWRTHSIHTQNFLVARLHVEKLSKYKAASQIIKKITYAWDTIEIILFCQTYTLERKRNSDSWFPHKSAVQHETRVCLTTVFEMSTGRTTPLWPFTVIWKHGLFINVVGIFWLNYYRHILSSEYLMLVTKMPDIILLGGESKKHEQWIREVETILSPYFSGTHVLMYTHWTEGSSTTNVPHEVGKLVGLVQSLPVGKEYAIFGKSIGTIITVEAIRQGRISPKFCIFAGVPIKYPVSHSDNYARLASFQRYETPTLVIQNPDERFMNPVQLRETFDLIGVRNCEVIAGVGGEHSYAVTSLSALVHDYVVSKV